MIPQHEAQPILSYGSFFGRFLRQRAVPGFSISDMTPLLPPSEIRRHTHEDAHFVLVLEGLYISQARHAPSIAKAPILIYNPPGTTHRDRFHTLDGRFLTISIASDRLKAVAENIPLLEESILLENGRARTLAQRVARELRQWQPASALVAEGLGLELLAEVAANPEPGDRLPPRWLGAARELLREQCTESSSIADVAAGVGVHPVHLARTFRKFFHCTPGEYLRNCRLERAAALLIETCLPLAVIALESGFADQSHFSKAFSQNFGSSPGEHRRRFGRSHAWS